MKVHIDLRRDLPKLQDALPQLLGNMGGVCQYAQPCAVGVMVEPEKRAWLDGAPSDGTGIDTLIQIGMVEVPNREQVNELSLLQSAFDCSNADRLVQLVDSLALKYGLAARQEPQS